VYPEFADFVLEIVKIIGIEGGSRNRADGILNAPSRVEVATMKSKQILMSALIGFAMLATPIVASAKDHKGDGRNYSHQSESRSFNAGNKHEFKAGNKHEFHNQGGNGRWAAAPYVAARHDWNEDRHENRWNEDRHDNGLHRGWRNRVGDADDYRDYGSRGYYAGPAYAPYYGRQGYAGYAGGACGWAQHVQNVYTRDRNTGHPAAAADLLPQLRRAQQACGGVPYGGGLFSGFGGYGGDPAYSNYGGYNGYNNSNYGAYNGGYGQPYGYGGGSSMLAPLLQQFVH